MIDRQHVDGQHLVARYLANQLSNAEQLAFEEFLCANPDMLQELETTANFKLGLCALQEDGQLDAALRPRPTLRRVRFAVAAVIALVGLLVLAVVVDWRDTPAVVLLASRQAVVDRQGTKLPEGGTFEILHERSAQDTTTIELPPTPSIVTLQVLPDAPNLTASYRMRLMHLSSDGISEVGQLAGLKPDPEGFITAFLSSTALPPGRYQLVVGIDSITQTSAADSPYLIEVMQSAPHPLAP